MIEINATPGGPPLRGHGQTLSRKGMEVVVLANLPEKTLCQERKVDENDISKHIVDCAIEVHRTLGGPGLLESVYEEALCWELAQRGLRVERQIDVPIVY